MAADWSLAEAEAIASDYFSMLERSSLNGALDKTCVLDASQFIARVG